MLLIASLQSADPYQAWSQGRPAESAAALETLATTAAGWQDAGLAHAAAGATGPAVAALLRAHRTDPTLASVAPALRAVGTPFPATLHERLGPIAVPGTQWWGVGLCGLAGLAVGLGLVMRRGRGVVVTLGLLLLGVVVPGLVASYCDRRHPWTTNLQETSALDASGATVAALTPGTLLERTASEPWNGRSAVRLPDGRTAFVASAVLAP